MFTATPYHPGPGTSGEPTLRLSRLALPTLALVCTGSIATPAAAQTPLARPHIATEPIAHQPTSGASELPITRVALYKNGVGFFEHAGRVVGNQAVTIDFTSAQLNDVLQSLTAIDLNGGRISGAAYNSTTPLDQQLKSLPLTLDAEPSDVDFYNAIRGARVQVSAPGASITGRLLTIDLRAQTRKNSDNSTDETGDRRFITVVSDPGAVRTLELTPAVTVTLLDTALHTDVTRYLELLASTRNQGLRHLTLLDRGTGTRDLRVSYISEVPVWKSTYRILLTDAKQSTDPSVTLQGWSVVDNTTGSDWNNVHLDLIAGAPQSFIQPLSIPYYSRRPEIPLPSEAQLAPQTHDSGSLSDNPNALSTELNALAGPSAGPGGGQVFVNGFTGGQLPKKAAPLRLGNGSASGIGSTNASVTVLKGRDLDALSDDPNLYQQRAAASIVPQTTTNAFDDFFEYSLTDPITIRKNESALVPILQTRLPVERVTLWSAAQPVALRALWITNASQLTLDRGSFSIVENGNFGGEGLLDPIHPGEKRLLSYAADQAVRVSTDRNTNNLRVQRVTIAKGVLTETSTDVNEVDYAIRNAAPDPRTVILEQPILKGWTLDNGDSDPKPAETTPTAYRFRVPVSSQQTSHLKIAQRHTNQQYIRLVDRTQDQLTLLLRNDKVSPAALAQLQPVFDAHFAVVALDDQIRAREAEIAAITKDQDRLRENMKALKGSPEEKALLTRYTGELNAQEDRLAAIHNELTQLHAQRTAADLDFQNKLNAVNFDETL
jgi:hypothetical protein